jgi:hypothetical protein
MRSANWKLDIVGNVALVVPLCRVSALLLPSYVEENYIKGRVLNPTAIIRKATIYKERNGLEQFPTNWWINLKH